MPQQDHPTEVKRITPEGEHFHFGYYDRVPISADGRYHLAIHPEISERSTRADDHAEIGLIDLHNGNAWIPLDNETAWNWQMGSNQQWLGSSPEDTFIYNVRDGDKAHARIRHIEDGVVRDLPHPVFDISSDGRYGVVPNFGRIHTCREGYGYPFVRDPWEGIPASEEDFLQLMDLESGETSPIVSVAQCANVQPEAGMSGGLNWFNHIMLSPKGTHILFLHRWQPPDEHWKTRFYCCGVDGSDLTLLNAGPHISHCDWKDENIILSYSKVGEDPWGYYIYDVPAGTTKLIGEDLFSSDGHCHYEPHPEKRWFVTDTYPDPEDQKRDLILYDTQTDTRYDLARLYSNPKFDADGRCDLHTRWDVTGTKLSSDSTHEGFRGIYMTDVSDLVSR
jgi:hypothetical protein